jgi:hypothetical protein
MSLQTITKQFEEKSIRVGDMFLFRPSDALDFIEACYREKLQLLGVEGFKLVGNKIQPFQEHSNDIADAMISQNEFYEQTRKFIEKRGELDLWFEVVVIEP